VAEKKKSVFVDLLDGTFSMISRTWLTSLLIGGVLFIPTSFLFGWAYGAFVDVMVRAGELGRGEPGPLLAAMGMAYLWIVLALLAQGLVYLFVRACVTEHTARAARGETADTFDVFLSVASQKYLKLVLQRIIQAAILSITLGGVTLVVSVAVGVAAALRAEVAAVLFGVILGLAGIALLVWISIRYAVTLESMVVDGTGVEQSFDQSMALVRYRWWRVFGWTLLFGLMVGFASSLVATPIVFFSTIRQFMQALQELMKEPSHAESFNTMFLKLFAGLSRRLGILQYVQSLLGVFVTPVFMTLLFLELKKPAAPEKGELPVTAPETPGASRPEARP